MGRYAYGEVKSVYRGKFKGRGPPQCHCIRYVHNVIVYSGPCGVFGLFKKTRKLENSSVSPEQKLESSKTRPFASTEARYEASIEADRAVATGHMEYVPVEEVEHVLNQGVVHPWTMDLKGSKWRACQDYSRGTSLAARSGPFALPTTWDVRRLVVPGKSHFANTD